MHINLVDIAKRKYLQYINILLLFIIGINIGDPTKIEASEGDMGRVERRRSPRRGPDTATHCHQRWFNNTDLKPQPPLPFTPVSVLGPQGHKM